MNTKIFIFLTLVGLCFAKPVEEHFTTKNPNALQENNVAIGGDAVTFRIATTVGFEDWQSSKAAELASQARDRYTLSQMAELTAYLRNLFDISFGQYWNCMAAYAGRGDFAGWRATRYIHLVSQAGDNQFFICSQGCNSGSCTKFGAIL